MSTFKTLVILLVISVATRVIAQTSASYVVPTNSSYSSSVPPGCSIGYLFGTTVDTEGCQVNWTATNAEAPYNSGVTISSGFGTFVTWKNVNGNATLTATTHDCKNASSNGVTATYSVPILYLGPIGALSVNGSSGSPQTISCGSQTVTFTVGAATNATNYNWDYSSLSGWTYVSGQGTTTLTMTSSAGSGGNITVTATRSGAGCNSSSTSTTIQRPTPGGSASISTPDLFCSGSSQSVSVANLPAGASVSSWQSSGNLSLSPSGSSATVSATGYSPGTAYITANVADCGTTVPITREVYAGPPSHNITGPGEICIYNSYYYALNTPSSYEHATYSWSTSSPNLVAISSGTSEANVSGSATGNYYLNVTGTNACGSAYYNYLVVVNNCSETTRVYPNPARDNVTLEFLNATTVESLPDQIDLIGANSMKPIHSLNVKDAHKNNKLVNGNSLQLNVKDVPRGVYYLHIKSGRTRGNPLEKIRVVIE
ncbi:T9SS type A sorting domain-containing protein [Spirosoma litoris]